MCSENLVEVKLLVSFIQQVFRQTLKYGSPETVGEIAGKFGIDLSKGIEVLSELIKLLVDVLYKKRLYLNAAEFLAIHVHCEIVVIHVVLFVLVLFHDFVFMLLLVIVFADADGCERC